MCEIYKKVFLWNWMDVIEEFKFKKLGVEHFVFWISIALIDLKTMNSDIDTINSDYVLKTLKTNIFGTER
jgi:hypothetical protein